MIARARRLGPLRWAAVALALLGLWAGVGGGWIAAKAALAQVLLRAAWAETSAGAGPARPWPWADTWPVARLRAPRLGVDQIVLAGASGRTLAFGPAHLGASAPPVSAGNTVLSGHRDSHFRFLAELRPGDAITITAPDGRARAYRVTATQVVHKDAARFPLAVDRPRLTLVTCWPFDAVVPGGPLRYVVVAEAP